MTLRLAKAVVVLASWQICLAHAAEYQHASGFSFTYPDTWQLRETPEFLLLFSQDTPQDADGVPHEFVLAASNATDPSIPAGAAVIAVYFDEQIQLLDPLATRQGEHSSSMHTGELNYASEQGRYCVRYKLVSGIGLYMVLAQRQQKLQLAAFEKMFSSFDGALSVDPVLVGRWSRNESAMTDISYSTANQSGAYVSADSNAQYYFGPDNSLAFGAQASVYSQSDGLSLGSSGANAPRLGTYSVIENRVIMHWRDGDIESCEYSRFETSEGPALKLICDGQRRFYRQVE